MNKNPIENIYPLSPLQQGILFHTLADRKAYFNQSVYALEGSLNVPAFKQAWQRVVDRHAIFRTLFLWERRSEPLQVVRPQGELRWVEQDWRGLSPAAQRERLEIFLSEDEERGLDLAAAPLMRMALMRTADAAFYFIWTNHHLLLDRWSSAIAQREVADLYRAFSQNRDDALNPCRPYRDYIAWLRRQDMSKAEEFWRRTLAGYTSPTTLKLERPAGAEIAGGYAKVETSASRAVTAALEAFARRHRLTMNTIVQGAWAILLSRYSGEEDVVFGATVSGRPADLAGAERMVGLFINTLPVRAAAPPGDLLLPWLQRLQDYMVELRQYEYSPLIRIQEWSPVPRGTPLFESILVFENIALESHTGETDGGIKTTHVRSSGGGTRYPLTLVALPGPELWLGLTYDRRRFDAPAMTRMLEHLRTLLESFAAPQDAKLAELSMLTETERRSQLEWNGTSREYPRDKSVHELFERQAERTPQAVAVIFPATDTHRSRDQRLTYDELNRRANQLAHRLRRAGVEPEARVGVYLERSAEMIVALLGVLKAGAAYVPLDLDSPQERVYFMLADSRAKFLVTQKNFSGKLPEWSGETIDLEPDWKALEGEPEVNPASDANGASLAYVIYTSGSTGNPKGVAVPHRAINRLVINTDYARLGPDDVVAQAANAAFDAATFEIWGALLNGARLVGLGADVILSPRKLAGEIERQKITALFLTTALFNLLAQEMPAAFKNVRHLLFGGEAADPKRVAEVLRHGPPQRLVHVYGPTETTTFASWHLVKSVDENAATIPIGRPIANSEIYLLDRHLNPAPVGVAGELYIGGDGLARCYINRPDLTDEKFVRDPFSADPEARLYKTGDLARRLPDGGIEFVGRGDDQVKIRGFRVEPGEIEAALGQHPTVRDVVVIAREQSENPQSKIQNPKSDRRLVAYVVPARQPAPTDAQLRDFLKTKLPGYMIPAAFVFLESFPLTPNGKVDRRALPAPGRSTPGRREFAAPSGLIEQELARVWEELLSVRPIGADDDFFDLGGHSLLAVQMTHRIEQACGQRLPLTALLAGPTIRQLAEALRKHRVEENRSLLVKVQPEGSKTPLFFLHGDFRRGGFYCLILARCLGTDRPFYALAPHGLNGSSVPETVEAMAASYIEMVREVQPHGPYLLGGFCNGGTVALEMARELREHGEAVALVVLVAAPARNRSAKRFARRLTDRLGALLGLGPEKSLRMFLALRARVRPVQRLVRRARGFRLKGASATRDLFLGALSAYVLKPYSGPVAHFWPAESGAAADAVREWSRAVPHMNFQTIPGNHVTCVSVHAEVLGELMRARLEEMPGKNPSQTSARSDSH